MELNGEQLAALGQFSVVRLDGAWFLALAKKYGIETAWEIDVDAWKQFSYVFGKKLRAELIPDPVWPESFIEAMEIFSQVLKIEGRQITLEDNQIIVRVTDCETQKAIAKAGVADCGIATVATYQGIARGLFGKAMDFEVRHTRNLNHGDEFCEVIIQDLTRPAG